MKREFDARKYGYLVKMREYFINNQMANIKPKRLGRCNAYIYDCGDGVKWLKSYNTIVAVYLEKTDTVYSFGRYSATTYQQVRKFRNNQKSYYRTNEVNIWYEDRWDEFSKQWY